MIYTLEASAVCDIGATRIVNQDNIVLGNTFLEEGCKHFITSVKTVPAHFLVGVFDGLGGEQCGEHAAYIAAETAASMPETTEQPFLHSICMTANERICSYMTEHHVRSMGTTAAMLLFTENSIYGCSIGDSKILLYRDGRLSQVSDDDYLYVEGDKKPPLSQCLGIPQTEMLIEPHLYEFDYRIGDRWILCSDGLTDMVPAECTYGIINKEGVAVDLADEALRRGGKDNVSIITIYVV